MPLLFFQQSPAPVPVHQIESGSESSPFLALPWLIRLSQPAAQSHARTGSSPPLADGRLKCRRYADRSRTPDSHELSLKTTRGHRLLRLRLSGNRQNDFVPTPTDS